MLSGWRYYRTFQVKWSFADRVGWDLCLGFKWCLSKARINSKQSETYLEFPPIGMVIILSFYRNNLSHGLEAMAYKTKVGRRIDQKKSSLSQQRVKNELRQAELNRPTSLGAPWKPCPVCPKASLKIPSTIWSEPVTGWVPRSETGEQQLIEWGKQENTTRLHSDQWLETLNAGTTRLIKSGEVIWETTVIKTNGNFFHAIKKFKSES